MNGDHDDQATGRSMSRDHNGVNPLAQLFDLATDLVLPFKPYPTMEWPLDESFAPFRAQINKVAMVLADVAQNIGVANREGKSNQRKDCYVMEYVYETVFQRFFAWAVSKAPRQPGDDASSFWYRNGWANARAVLAMPLVIDLFHEMAAVIRQGNFGYRPSPTADWVYPHLADYCRSLYFPWILAKSDGLAEPQYDATQGDPADAALERCCYRSRQVTFDLWKLLRKGFSLRELVDRQKDIGEIIPLHKLRDSFWRDFPYNHSCRFTIQAVASDVVGLNTVWARPWVDDPVPDDEGLQSELIQEVLQNDLPQAIDFAAFIKAVPDAVIPLINKIIEDIKLKSQAFGSTIEDGRRFLTRQRFGQFIRWRFLEERLRFVVDRQLWERRVFDPPLPRAWKENPGAIPEEENPVFLPDFERRGIRSILTPEIQFAICLDEILDPVDGRAPQTCFPKQCSLLESAKTNPPQNSMKECRGWLSMALDKFLDNPSGFEAELEETRQFPLHSLLLMSTLEKLRQDPIGSSKHAEWITKYELSRGVLNRNFFALGLLLAAVVPLPETLSDQEKLGLLGHTKNYIRGEMSAAWKPWAELIEVQDLLQAPPLMMPSTYWAWLKKALPKAYGEESLSDLADVTLDDVKLSDKWEPSSGDFRCEKYFAYRGLLGMNPAIFQSLAELGHGYNAFGVRLIAEEAEGASSERLSDDYQDFAEFLGSYIVWKSEDDTRLNGVDSRCEPRLDMWSKLLKEPGPFNRSECLQDPELSQWMNDLERQKIMVRMLGRVVVDRHQRIARQRVVERMAGEAARADLGAGMFHNLTHHIMPISVFAWALPEDLMREDFVAVRSMAKTIFDASQRLLRFQTAVKTHLKQPDAQHRANRQKLTDAPIEALRIQSYAVLAAGVWLKKNELASVGRKYLPLLGYLADPRLDLSKGARHSDKLALKEWLKSQSGISLMSLSSDADKENLCTWWRTLFGLSVDILGDFSVLRGDSDILTGVLEELILNAIVAAAEVCRHGQCATSGACHVWISAIGDGDSGAIHIENYSRKPLSEKVFDRPEGDKGWGMYGSRLLLERAEWTIGILPNISCQDRSWDAFKVGFELRAKRT